MTVNPIGGKAAGTVADAAEGSKLRTTPAVSRAVTTVNSARIFGQDNELTIALDRGTKRTVVRLVDRKTGEVVRQIPAETLLRLAEAVEKPGL